MINNAFGLIYAGEANMNMKDLASERSLAAVPFAGRYRSIDFPLSNLVNTGVRNIGVITQRNYNSLMDHIGGGGAWDLHRKRDGLFVLPPFVNRETPGVYQGTIDALRGAANYIERAPYRYCILMSSHTIYNASYEEMMKQHIESGADVTALYNIEPADAFAYEDSFDDVRFVLNERNRIVDMEFDTARPKSSNCSMNCFILDKSLLTYLLDESAGKGFVDFTRDILFRKLDTLKIFGYRYDDHVVRLSSVGNYFRENLALLRPDVRADLFSKETPIYTKVKDEVPARYAGSAIVKNCMVADGCVIEGEIENCVLFRGVRIARGARLKNCVIMQGSEIAENAELENVILDKDVTVRSHGRLIAPSQYPIVIGKNVTL